MLFFELLQVALGQKNILSSIPSDEEWLELFQIAQKQAVSGVIIAALERLSTQEQKPSQKLLLEWIGISEQIRQRNISLTKRCKQLQQKLRELGNKSSILKGQGVALYYDDSLRDLRQSGDIDIYVDCGLKEAISLAYSFGQRNVNWDYQHMHINLWPDVEIEVHYRAEILFNLNRNKKLQKWFKDNQELLFTKEGELIVPSVSANLVYVLLHIYRHFLTEGVGLRQLMDFYFVLKRANGCFEVYTDGRSLEETLKEFGVYRFTQGLMWVLQEVFGLERVLMICAPVEREGSFILAEIMSGGKFWSL